MSNTIKILCSPFLAKFEAIHLEVHRNIQTHTPCNQCTVHPFGKSKTHWHCQLTHPTTMYGEYYVIFAPRTTRYPLIKSTHTHHGATMSKATIAKLFSPVTAAFIPGTLQKRILDLQFFKSGFHMFSYVFILNFYPVTRSGDRSVQAEGFKRQVVVGLFNDLTNFW